MENQNRFGFAGDVDDTIDYQVIPYLIQVVDLDEKHYPLVDQFLDCYKTFPWKDHCKEIKT